MRQLLLKVLFVNLQLQLHIWLFELCNCLFQALVSHTLLCHFSLQARMLVQHCQCAKKLFPVSRLSPLTASLYRAWSSLSSCSSDALRCCKSATDFSASTQKKLYLPMTATLFRGTEERRQHSQAGSSRQRRCRSSVRRMISTRDDTRPYVNSGDTRLEDNHTSCFRATHAR